MQADMALEEELRVLDLNPQAAGRDSDILARLEHIKPQSPPQVTHFLQQDHNS